MKILVTGFKPFLKDNINPSELLSLELAQKYAEVSSLVLPVEFENSFKILRAHLVLNTYDFIILLGQAAGRSKISLEKIALNWVQTESPDEIGVRPEPGVILETSELALMTNFPIARICAELNKQDLPVEISFSAGTFVCNDLYYRALKQFPELMILFIHLPLIQNQINETYQRPFLELEFQKNILSQLILEIVK